MPIATIPTRAFTEQNLSFKNIIINGDMSIAQRATSASGLSSGVSYDSIDRYKTQIVNAGTWTISQSTTVPTGEGFGYSLKMDCTTADTSLGADDFLVVQQVIEAQNLQYLKYGTSNAESITMSFWVRSNKTGTYSVWLFQDDNNKTISAPYTINSANTWEKKTITFAGDTASSITNDNGQGIRVYFVLAAGSNWTSGTTPTTWQSDSKSIRAPEQTVNLADNTANEWYITGIQLEAGTTASDFEFLPYDVNLDRCMRYCQIIGDTTDANNPYAVGMANSATDFRGVYNFKKEMRATPSATVSSASDFRIFESGGVANVVTALAFNQASKRSCQVDADTSGLVAGQACLFRKLSSQDSAKVTLDAEL